MAQSNVDYYLNYKVYDPHLYKRETGFICVSIKGEWSGLIKVVEAVARVERRGLITLLNIHPLLQAVSQPCTARRMHSNCNKCIYAERYLETDELNA